MKGENKMGFKMNIVSWLAISGGVSMGKYIINKYPTTNLPKSELAIPFHSGITTTQGRSKQQKLHIFAPTPILKKKELGDMHVHCNEYMST